MPLEIVQIVQELSSSGGAETVAYELARAFDTLRVENRVLASVAGPEARKLNHIEFVAPGWRG